MNQVSVFDNLDTFMNQVVYITKSIVHTLSKLPDLIGNSIVTASEFASYCPPFIAWMILFILFTGLMMKTSHWGS